MCIYHYEKKAERNCLMPKLIRFPKILEEFFKPVESCFNKCAIVHFKAFCILMAASCEHDTVNKIASFITFGAHRTNCNEFLLSPSWEEDVVLKNLANRRLRRLYKKLSRKKNVAFAILDDSKKKKVGKKTVEGAGKTFDPAFKKYVHAHQILTLTIYYQGQTTPYGIKLYLKKSVAKKLRQPFKKLPELAAELINEISLPFDAPVYVLTDSFYVNKTVIAASRARGFHFIGALKTNRTFFVKGQKTNVKSYVKNAFRRKQKSNMSIHNSNGVATYSFFSMITNISKIGESQITFSRKNSKKKVLALICTDLSLNPQDIIQFYSFRWSIEVWFKQLKQHLSFGAMHRRVLRGVITHLHLSACAYMLLTHLHDSSEKGKRKNNVATFSMTALQNQLRTILFQDMFDAFIEKFRILPVAVDAIKKMKGILFDERKVCQLAI